MKTKYIIILGLIIATILVLNSSPRFITQDLPSIGIVECECSDEYNIICKSWLYNSDRYTCEIPDDSICGTCVKKSSLTPSTPSSIKGP
jgi:hypothetical protein